MKPLLILRPEPGASATADRARELGLTPLVRPLFRIAPRAWDAPDPVDFDALVLTSANAVRNAGPDLAKYGHLPTFVVGSATAKAARKAGLENLAVPAHNAAQLFRSLDRQGLKRVLHLAGEDRTPYPDLLFAITTRVVYASEPGAPDLPEPPYVALLHSARAAEHFRAACGDPAQIDIVAISDDVADAAGEGWRSAAFPRRPDDNAMLALAAPLCEDAGMPTAGQS